MTLTTHDIERATIERCAKVCMERCALLNEYASQATMEARGASTHRAERLRQEAQVWKLVSEELLSLQPSGEDGVVVPRVCTPLIKEWMLQCEAGEWNFTRAWEVLIEMLSAAQSGNEQRGPKGSATSADLSDAEAVTAKADPHQQAPSGAQEAAKLECSVYINGKRAPDQDAARKLFADACRRTKHAAPSATQQGEQDLDRACANATKRMETIREKKSGLPAEAAELVRSFTICKDHVNADWNQPELDDLDCVLCRLFYLEAQECLLEEWQQRAKRAEDAIAEIKRPLDAQMERLNNTVVQLNTDNERQSAEIERLRGLLVECEVAFSEYTEVVSSMNDPNSFAPKMKDEGNIARKMMKRIRAALEDRK